MDDLVELAKLGIRARNFFDSDLGTYVVERAHKEREDAMQALQDTDPFAGTTIAEHQNRIRVATSAIQWLADAIEAGHAAEHQIKQLEGEQGE